MEYDSLVEENGLPSIVTVCSSYRIVTENSSWSLKLISFNHKQYLVIDALLKLGSASGFTHVPIENKVACVKYVLF